VLEGVDVANGLAEVSVADTGVGIVPADRELVFEEFRQVGTADKKVEGTGLGLVALSEVHRTPRRPDLGHECGRRWLDVLNDARIVVPLSPRLSREYVYVASDQAANASPNRVLTRNCVKREEGRLITGPRLLNSKLACSSSQHAMRISNLLADER
jgi:hypothetical protein